MALEEIQGLQPGDTIVARSNELAYQRRARFSDGSWTDSAHRLTAVRHLSGKPPTHCTRWPPNPLSRKLVTERAGHRCPGDRRLAHMRGKGNGSAFSRQRCGGKEHSAGLHVPGTMRPMWLWVSPARRARTGEVREFIDREWGRKG